MTKKNNPQQQIRKALKFCENLQFADAIVILQSVIGNYPNQLEALTLLGTVYLHQKNFKLGIEFLKKSLTINPKQSFALNNIGNGYYELKDYQSAISSFDKAIIINPNDFKAYYDRARAFDAINENTRAISSYENAIKINPSFTESYVNIAISLKKIHEYKKAILCLNEGLALNNQDINLYLLLGEFLEDVCEHEEAISKYKEALRIEPNSIRILEKIVFSALNNPSPNFEIEILDKLLQLDANNFKANMVKAKIENYYGNFETSIKFYRKLISIDPLNTPAYYHDISTMQNLSGNSVFKVELLKVIDCNLEAKFNEIFYLYFALGKFFKDQKNYKESFKNYSYGRSLKKKSSKYNVKNGILELTDMKERFNQQCIDKLSPYASDSDLPVFVVGMPRSGTTLIESILSTKHSRVAGIGESAFWEPTSDLSIFESEDYKSKYEGISERYIKAIRYSSGNDNNLERIIDKLPHNFVRLGIIASIFPNARIIHCNRNPIDTCLSIFTTPLTSNFHDYANDLRDLALYYVEYIKLMDYWENLFPNRIFNINYEDIVKNNKLLTEKLFIYLNLNDEGDMKNTSLLNKAIQTASSWQVRQPLHKKSVNKFENYKEDLDPLIKIFEEYPSLINLN